MSPPRVRVAVVEDEPLFRSLLEQYLVRHDRLQLVGAFPDGPALLGALDSVRPDVVTLDIELPGRMDGIQTGLSLRRVLPHVGIVVLSNHDDPRFVASLPQDAMAGWSYLLKKSVRDVDALGRAVEGAAAGAVVIDPQLVADLQPRSGGPLLRLTPRQREILSLLAQGLTNAVIAERLVLAEKSVENQLTAIYSALDIDRREESVHPRVSAVLVYLRESRRQTATSRRP
jgi:DNA-binding NarL/FixJ family response regulator